MYLEQATLFTVTGSITGLLGFLLLVLWLRDRTVRALAWWGVAYVLGAVAVTLWSVQGAYSFVPAEVPNTILFVACGMIWNGARLFHGRPVMRLGLIAGAAVWWLAMQASAFAASEHARTVLSCLVIATYAFLTAFELRQERRRELAAQWFWMAIPLLHSAVFLAPIALLLMLPTAVSSEGLFALFAFETVIYAVGTAFVVVVLAKDRIAFLHKTAAMTDLLTGLLNRRAFMEEASRLVSQRAQAGQAVSVLLFDLDNFKSINDRHGHAMGDKTLKLFASVAGASLRTNDLVGRLGGEEFAVMLRGNAGEAGLVGERLRSAFEAAGAEIEGCNVRATASVGAATGIAPLPIDWLLMRADAALYRAKHNGRNRLEFDNDELGFTPPLHAAPDLAQPFPAMR